jgi:hypothetical protein
MSEEKADNNWSKTHREQDEVVLPYLLSYSIFDDVS